MENKKPEEKNEKIFMIVFTILAACGFIAIGFVTVVAIITSLNCFFNASSLGFTTNTIYIYSTLILISAAFMIYIEYLVTKSIIQSLKKIFGKKV